MFPSFHFEINRNSFFLITPEKRYILQADTHKAKVSNIISLFSIGSLLLYLPLYIIHVLIYMDENTTRIVHLNAENACNFQASKNRATDWSILNSLEKRDSFLEEILFAWAGLEPATQKTLLVRQVLVNELYTEAAGLVGLSQGNIIIM